jgi:hypothetical protein
VNAHCGEQDMQAAQIAREPTRPGRRPILVTYRWSARVGAMAAAMKLPNARLESDIMATLDVDGNNLVVRLSALEKIGALRGDIRLPLAAVCDVRVSDAPWSELRGIRAPGTGIPGIISLCTRRGRGVHDFAAVYGRRPAVVVEMSGVSFDRLVVSCADAAEAAARAADITRACGASRR